MLNFLKSLTPMQWFAITLAVLGVLGASAVQLNDLFGPTTAKTIVTTSNLLMTLMSSIMVPLTGQSAQVQAVRSMPGVESVLVNENANRSLARMAVDPAETKIEIVSGAKKVVNATAKGE